MSLIPSPESQAEHKINIALQDLDIHLRDLVSIDVEIEMQKRHVTNFQFVHKNDERIARAELDKLMIARAHKLNIISSVEAVCKEYLREIKKSASKVRQPS